MIYVDDARLPFRNMKMCHLMAIPHNEKELKEFAMSIGIDSKYYQKSRHPHFDICESKRKKAISYGAIEIGFVELVKMSIESNRQKAGE